MAALPWLAAGVGLVVLGRHLARDGEAAARARSLGSAVRSTPGVATATLRGLGLGMTLGSRVCGTPCAVCGAAAGALIGFVRGGGPAAAGEWQAGLGRRS